MKLYKTGSGIVMEHESKFYLSTEHSWDMLVNRTHLYNFLLSEIKYLEADESLARLLETSLKAPVGTQEIWASGVTYMRSREARMEESKTAGGGDFYARVYDAERPELFFKASADRVVGHGQNVRTRKDSNWNVPEPELTLFFSSQNTIEGYTIGNDMSSRDIEGENPLYLP
ncbi:MAG TPA: 2-hydroxyhepta-2,4-diene-1,7-dioate isomerase, partial [Chitinophagaceae bacterium]